MVLLLRCRCDGYADVTVYVHTRSAVAGAADEFAVGLLNGSTERGGESGQGMLKSRG